MKTEDFSERRDELAGWAVNITVYRIDETWHCRIDNVSPGATVARGTGSSREEAERVATEKASERLGRTRTH